MNTYVCIDGEIDIPMVGAQVPDSILHYKVEEVMRFKCTLEGKGIHTTPYEILTSIEIAELFEMEKIQETLVENLLNMVPNDDDLVELLGLSKLTEEQIKEINTQDEWLDDIQSFNT